jgi:HD-like signal output (HDOD) protein
VEITSVHFAIARLGMGEVRNIVITTGVVGAMNRRGGGGLDYAVFWRHCLFVAAAARAVAEHAARSNPAIDPRDPAHFVAGLLHDIGILVLDQTVHSVYEDVLRHVRDTGEPLHLVERRVLGVDHQDVGRLICERWHLPAAVAVTARYHHQPWDADEKTRASALVTYAAEQIGTAMDPAPFHGSADPLWLERVSGALNLSDGNMDSLTDKVRAALDQSETLRAMLTDS